MNHISLAKFRAFRELTRKNAITQLGYPEYVMRQTTGFLIRLSFKMAKRRGDFAAMNASRLALWAGNQSDGGLEAHAIKPHLISKALKEKRVRIVIDSDDGEL